MAMESVTANALRNRAYAARFPERIRAKNRAYYQKNKEKVLATHREWREENPEHMQKCRDNWEAENSEYLAATRKQWRARNADKVLAQKADWKAQNPGYYAATCAKRRARKLQATPKWLTSEQRQEILETYRTASLSGKHVDHIIPLQGETVCGLHVPWNLQLLSKSENSAKGNRIKEKSIDFG